MTLFDKLQAAAQGLVNASGMNVQLAGEARDKGIYFNLTGPDSHHFTAHRGEVLRDISFVLHSLARKHDPSGELEVKFDAEHFLEMEENEILRGVLASCQALEQGRTEVEVGPFNPYERRVIHMSLEDRFETESIGDGHIKMLRIRRKS